MKRITILLAALAVIGAFQGFALAARGSRVAGPARPAAALAPERLAVPQAQRAADKEPAPPPAVERRTPDPRAPRGDLIEISIARQELTAWRDGAIVMRFLISTGKPGYETPTGRYRVYWKTPRGWSTKWKVYMPWAMAWNGNYMIHQLPHYPNSSHLIGGSTLGTPASHGCVRVDVGDAERLYRWTAVGTPVWVH